MRVPLLWFSILALLVIGGPLQGQDGSIPRDGLTLYYRTEGSGKPIVFLSGGPGIEVDYIRPAAELFPREYQRVFLEQRGTGRSRPSKLTAEHMTLRLMVEDLEALRKHLNLDRLLLAGHSWGGVLAMAYASLHPESVDKLILIDSGGPTREFFEWFPDNIEARLRPEDKEARRYWMDAVKQGIDVDEAASGVARAIAPAYFFDRAKGLAFAAQSPGKNIHQDANSLLSVDLQRSYEVRSELPKLLRPVLIIHGHQDPMGDKAWAVVAEFLKSR